MAWSNILMTMCNLGVFTNDYEQVLVLSLWHFCLGDWMFDDWLELICKPNQTLVPAYLHQKFLSFALCSYKAIWKIKNDILHGGEIPRFTKWQSCWTREQFNFIKPLPTSESRDFPSKMFDTIMNRKLPNKGLELHFWVINVRETIVLTVR